MSRKDKLLSRLKTMPKDFSYDELIQLLIYLGYKEDNAGKTSGSAVRFINCQTKHIMRIHKPHPENTLKMYVLKYVLEELLKEGVI